MMNVALTFTFSNLTKIQHNTNFEDLSDTNKALKNIKFDIIRNVILKMIKGHFLHGTTTNSNYWFK